MTIMMGTTMGLPHLARPKGQGKTICLFLAPVYSSTVLMNGALQQIEERGRMAARFDAPDRF
ncbi:MAG TPA: hypothetical protein VGR67_06370 [Candidatus Polarisedimenticolia bacterium]|jgi:hypothetical protein|nr:hypothetical protein [Candidatus Polarisedimenticolia bacterium]